MLSTYSSLQITNSETSGVFSAPFQGPNGCFCMFDGNSYYETVMYLFPDKVGIAGLRGQFQPYARYTAVYPNNSPDRQETEVGTNYIIAGFNGRLGAFWQYGNLASLGTNYANNATGSHLNAFKVAFQVQYYEQGCARHITNLPDHERSPTMSQDHPETKIDTESPTDKASETDTSRRDFLILGARMTAGVGVAALLGDVGGWALSYAADKEPIKIGVRHSLSGTMAISEGSRRDVVLMAVEDINAKGGLLGRKIQPVVVDPASNWDLFAEKAKQLLLQDKVAVVFGCWTSVSRKSVLPVFEKNNGLLFYPVQYEGEECSHNVFYTGAAVNQQAVPAGGYLLGQEGGGRKKVFLFGGHYVYPPNPNKNLPAELLAQKGPLGHNAEECTALQHHC